MHVIILAAPDSQAPEDLAARFGAAGHQVSIAPSDAHLEGQTRQADALIDLWVTDPDRKLAALRRYERWLPRDKPVLSACHASSATALAAALSKQPDRLSGFALLPPWDERKTIECALPLQAGPEAQRGAEAVWSAIGLEAVWVGDAVGLVMPRIIAGLANEACFALGEGLASAADIDRAMMLGTRYPRGPLSWAELIGLPEVLAILDALQAEHREDRYRAAPLLRRLVAAGRKSLYDSGADPSA